MAYGFAFWVCSRQRPCQRLLNGLDLKFLCKLTCCMGFCAPFHFLGSLCCKPSRMVGDYGRSDKWSGTLIFFIGQTWHQRQGLHLPEYHLPITCLASSSHSNSLTWDEVKRSYKCCCTTFSTFFSIGDGEELLQPESALHFWNHVFDKGSKDSTILWRVLASLAIHLQLSCW